jgi:hypothetical protein
MLKYIILVEYWRGDDISLGWLVAECNRGGDVT